MTEADGRQELLASTETIAIVSPRGSGRPPGRKNNKPNIQGWHEEEESARILGEDVQTRRRKRRAGQPPYDWVRHGRHVLYRDGCEEEHLASELRKRTATAEPRRRGRPRRLR
jgi:hypothetical protein